MAMSETPIKAAIVPVTPYQQNCSLVWCTRTRRGAAIDPGGDLDRLRAAIAREGIVLEKVLLTHGHLDHASGATRLARDFGGLPIEGPHRDDQFLLDALGRNAARPGFPEAENCTPTRWLEDGDAVTIGDAELGVRHCPGHTPGHVVFFHAGARVAFVGDVLFAGSVGRSDLPRGNHQQLVEAIVTRLWPLGDDMHFVPGHGQMSTFGWERKTNPYVCDMALEIGRELDAKGTRQPY
jgi:hydroxyacylglutathione hydrolase